MTKVGFIGAGNMATAIIEGLLNQQFTGSSDIFVYDIDAEKLENLSQRLGVQVTSTPQMVVGNADVVILAVKPNMIETVLLDVKNAIRKKRTIVVSIAAGLSIDTLDEILKLRNQPVVRVMPNMNAHIGMSATAVCGNASATLEDITLIRGLFDAVGKTWEIAEKDFANFTSMAGCSPAFTYLFIDSMARSGVKNGLPKDVSTEIAAQAVLGSAKMLLESSEHPWELIDKVCSPGGTTVAGVVALEDDQFMSTVIKALEATIARDEELASEGK